MKKKLLCRVLNAALVLSASACVEAATLTWDGSDTTTSGAQGGSGTWDTNTTANWWDGSANVVWPALGGLSDDAVFENTAGTVTLGAGGVTAHNLTFNTTGYVLTGSTLTLNGTTPTISTNTGVTSTINSIIAGSAVLTKTGAGTLVLGGVNTYTGGTTVSVGTLQAVVNTTQSGISSGAVSVASGATLQLDNTSTANLTIANTITGAGTLKLNFAANTTPRNTTLNNVTGFTGTIRLANAGATGDKWTIGGLTASGASVVVEDGSQLFVSTGTSTFAGINAIGTGNNETRGAIRLGGTLVGTVTLAGNTTIGTEGGTISGNITSGASGTQTLTLGTTNSTGNATLSGIIGGGTGTIALNKTAAGTVTLTGVNTYTGPTTIEAGIVTLNGSIDGSPLLDIKAGTTFHVLTPTGYALSSIQTLTGSGTLTVDTGGLTAPFGSIITPGTNGTVGVLTVAIGVGQFDISGEVILTGAPSLNFDLAAAATSDKVDVTSSTLNIGEGMFEIDDFNFTTLAGYGPGTYTLIATSNAIVGTFGANVTGTIGGENALLTKGDGGTDIVLVVGGSLTDLQNWRMTYFGTTENTGDAANTFDKDGDGLANVLEYLLGSNPTLSSQFGDVSVSQVGSNLVLKYSRKKASLAEVTPQVETSTSLQTGTWVTTGVTTTIISDDNVTQVVEASVVIGDPNEKRFLRLRATTP